VFEIYFCWWLKKVGETTTISLFGVQFSLTFSISGGLAAKKW
jgi:hypothetical protein